MTRARTAPFADSATTEVRTGHLALAADLDTLTQAEALSHSGRALSEGEAVRVR